MLRIAIVGLGSWGVCALERVVTTARRELRPGINIAVHVIEPGTPGSGVYDVTQPDYLLLNNPCGELSLYPFETELDQPCYGVGLYGWAVARGYRWVGERCVIDSSGAPIEPHHFLPRRLMGEYLQWFYRELCAGAPTGVHIVHHPTAAVDLVERHDGSEEVHLANGGTVVADHVIVTSGHTANQGREDGARVLEPYPVGAYVNSLSTDSTVAIAGMGLVAIDVVTALTIGRGGQFVEDGGGLRYRPSGREPRVQLFCRSGLPFTGKSITGMDRSEVYKPLICTDEALDQLSGRSHGRRMAVDVRSQLLPLLFAEMSARYYAQAAFQAAGSSRAAGAVVREQLGAAWAAGRFEDELSRLALRYGSFDAKELFFGRQPQYGCSDDYEQFVYQSLADDLREAEVPNGASPVKSAAEVFRIFRDRMRTVVEQGGLSLDSYLDFNADICSRIHRLVAGPPALRNRQFMALMDAGVVRMPYGPAPGRGLAPPKPGERTTRSRISSTSLEQPYRDDVDVMIRGHLEEPRIAGSASTLLTQLYNRGRVSQFRYGEVAVGSVDLTRESHPIDIEGRVQPRVSMFGVLTEGVRHFTQYIPSPRSRMRAFEDVGACVEEILADVCVTERIAA